MVLMDFNVETVHSHASLLGFDAISTYALPGGTIEVYKYFHNHFELFDISNNLLGNSICRIIPFSSTVN